MLGSSQELQCDQGTEPLVGGYKQGCSPKTRSGGMATRGDWTDHAIAIKIPPKIYHE